MRKLCWVKKSGRQLHDYANGMDPTPVLAEPEEAKGYSISTTLTQDVTDSDTAHKILPELADIHRQARKRCILDGELLCLVDGKPSFETIQRRSLMSNR